MSITVNIGGLQKTVTTPYVNIGGVWKTVNKVENNISGVWKQSYPDAWCVRLYRYGSLYTTLYCTKGSSITLVPTPSEYADDTFYGYSTAYNSVTRTYTGTQVIRPTSDVNLYAIYSFTATGSSVQQVHKYGSAGQTLTVTNAVIETTYSVFESISTPWWEVVQSDPSSTTIITHTSTETTTKIDNASVTSNAISYTFSNFQSTTINGPYGVSGKTSWAGWIDYTANVTQTGIKYRVVSHSTPSHINLYNYGSLERTIDVTEGFSTVAGALTPNVTGDTFYGWATSPNSTARVYTSLSNITPHGELNLYAIYTYTKSEEGFTEITSSNSTTQTVTTEYTGLVTVTFTYYASTPSGGVDGNTYVNGHHYCKIGNNSISANYNQSVAANTAIQFHGNYTSSTNTSCTYYTKVNYPTMVNNTYFRS